MHPRPPPPPVDAALGYHPVRQQWLGKFVCPVDAHLFFSGAQLMLMPAHTASQLLHVCASTWVPKSRFQDYSFVHQQGASCVCIMWVRINRNCVFLVKRGASCVCIMCVHHVCASTGCIMCVCIMCVHHVCASCVRIN